MPDEKFILETIRLKTSIPELQNVCTKQERRYLMTVYLKFAVDNDALNILKGSRLDQLQQIFHSILVTADLVSSIQKLR